MEPTITNREGRSLCAECGAPQPADPKRDPYLYHVTLGGMKKTDATKTVLSNDKENDHKYYQQSERLMSHQGSSKDKINLVKTPGDTSKHVFAKLNRSIDNIFPGRSVQYIRRPKAADELRYQCHLHSKRHPSKSMALVDHLL